MEPPANFKCYNTILASDEYSDSIKIKYKNLISKLMEYSLTNKIIDVRDIPEIGNTLYPYYKLLIEDKEFTSNKFISKITL